ncbi:carboxymuconolactone decarboxylase family protein [Paraburkholderia sp. CNPSo 3281]|nr:carboxymuconolactone decarboxylase family protein [Paraburkholderia sp. CNPSo 3281]MCP3721059.1 carboxymuconolactone decarboxylase family protein [Paraburkholderia sp. CNPSo 3281]
MKKAIENGLSRDEIVATITQLAFYAGWPAAMTALQIARKLFDETGK